jgi:hypothetical protein
MRRFVVLTAAMLLVVAACGGDDDDGGGEALGAAAFCDALQDTGDPLEGGDPADLADAVEEFEDVADRAPAAIRDDMQVMAGYLKSVAGGDIDDIDEGFDAFLDASTNVETWVAENCNGEAAPGGGGAGDDDTDDGGTDDGGDAATTTTAGDAGGLASSDFCERVAALEDSIGLEAVGEGDFSGLAESADVLDALVAEAPAEIRGDMEVTAEFLRIIADAYEGVDADDPAAALEVFEEIGPAIEELGAELAVAGANIERFLTEECGLELDTTDLGGGTGDEPMSYGEDPELDALWDACADGDGAACDELYYISPVNSDYEEFGNTCGGRFEPFEVICEDEL